MRKTENSGNQKRAFIVIAFTFLLTQLGWAAVPKIHAKGTVFGKLVDTVVDSEIAKYYIEEYLQGARTNALADQKIDGLYANQNGAIPTRDELSIISREFSVDFASLFLTDLLLSEKKNKELNQVFENYLGREAVFEPNVLNSYLILYVPGWNYVKNGRLTGADFAQPRKLASNIGFENYLVPLVSAGSVEENAKVLQATVHKHAQSGKKILIAGASSAGPVIHLALGEMMSDVELKPIKAWLNLGGILQGSPLLDFLQEGPRRAFFELVVWAEGWRKEAIFSMNTNQSRRRFERLKKNPGILVVNYMGVPLSGQLSKYSKDKYPLLKTIGPNDGLTLLTDIIAPNSMTIVSLGNDHFIAEDPQINKKTVALMELIIHALGESASVRQEASIQ